MNRYEIRLLQEVKGYPALTITLPTHRTAPDNRQDPIRLKNLVEQAVNRLLAELNKREAAPLIDRLQKLVDGIDYRYTLDGLALFVNRDFARAVQLPFTLPERVHIGDDFLTRDLVYAMNRTPRYWVLVLSEKPTRLFEATRDTLVEIKEDPFPLIHTGPGGEQPLPGGFGIRKSAIRDEYHRKFFRQVDAALKTYIADDPLPIVVVGVDRFQAFFKEVTSHGDLIVAALQGNQDKASPHELGKLVWPLAQEALLQRQHFVLANLEKAVGERRFVSTIGEVWRLAQEGRGQLLLVEENFHFLARINATDGSLVPAIDPNEPGVIQDAVDEVIETVLSKQGRVEFVADGSLAAHQKIALILRY